MEICKVIYEGGTGEIEEKKSRFIAQIVPAESEEEAAAFVNMVKKQYWDARHNCSAFVIGKHQELTRCSDDGEPSGTAGRPMLDVLLREGIHNAVVVVTRYFGGTLLGTGGLLRAYQAAVQEALANCVIIEKKQGRLLNLKVDYNDVGKLQYIFATEEIPTVYCEFQQDVQMQVVIPAGRRAQIEEKLTDATKGRMKPDWGGEVEYALVNQEVKIF